MPQSANLGHSQDRVLYMGSLGAIDLWHLFRSRSRPRLLKVFNAGKTRYNNLVPYWLDYKECRKRSNNEGFLGQ